MLYRAEVVTPWEEGVDRQGRTVFSPLLARVYPDHAMRITDLTGQSVAQIIPNPNSYTVEVICSGATLELIEADERFTVLPVTTEYVEDAETA